MERALDWESPRPGCASDSRGQVTHSLCISISSSVNTGDKDDSSLLGGIVRTGWGHSYESTLQMVQSCRKVGICSCGGGC